MGLDLTTKVRNDYFFVWVFILFIHNALALMYCVYIDLQNIKEREVWLRKIMKL